MKKSMSNKIVCVGNFSGPDIEEGTFHEEDTVTDVSHKSSKQQCPCRPVESHEAKASDDLNEDNEKDTGNND
ncbi:MAG: hypothetical protein KAS96_12190 [Planctomycetes bacterium]|nr:hypothetical protein [Planctomycetota bacterium]